MSVRTFDRQVDTTWRRTSYSALSAAGAPPSVDTPSEPEEQPLADEPPPGGTTGQDTGQDTGQITGQATGQITGSAATSRAGRLVPSPMADLPVGATFGSLVHAVLETADPEAADLAAELRARIDEQLVRWPVALDPDELAGALTAVCRTSLGPLADGAALADIPLRDRLRELAFELPLAGGDDRAHPSAPARLGDLAPLLRSHLPSEDPLRAFADALAEPRLGDQPLHGYLTGSIDAVLRLRDGADARFLVVDYKTNWLGGFRDEGAPLTSADYRPEALRAAMVHSDYPLQALLYAVVLHRYLRWRQPGYQPATHLGGVLYLYVRGMCGPATPVVGGQPCGVFSWQPPAALVEELSDLLDGRPVAGAGAGR